MAISYDGDAHIDSREGGQKDSLEFSIFTFCVWFSIDPMGRVVQGLRAFIPLRAAACC